MSKPTMKDFIMLDDTLIINLIELAAVYRNEKTVTFKFKNNEDNIITVCKSVESACKVMTSILNGGVNGWSHKDE